MAGASDYLETALLNHVLRNSAYTSPTTVYAALYTSAPTDAGGGTEIAAAGYARVAVTFGAPSGGVCSNSGVVTFGPITGGGGTAVAFGIFDASVAGNLLIWDDLSVNRTWSAGDSLQFNVGDLSVAVD